jgi:hypothetical protein
VIGCNNPEQKQQAGQAAFASSNANKGALAKHLERGIVKK